jgi:hypothetical protein
MAEEETDVKIDDVKDYIHSDEFKDVLKNAAENRLKIMNDYTPEMKDIKGDFVDLMSSGLSDSADEDEAKKQLSKNFKKIVDFHHYMGGWPKPESPAKLAKLADDVALAVKFLDFAQITSFRDFLAERGIYIDDNKSKKLKDDFPNLKDEQWENLRAILDDGSACQGNICKSADEIKINIFENEIPEELRYSKENKCGIKPGPFNKMVTAEAMKSVKDNDKLQKYANNLAEASVFNIAREEILKDRFTDMLTEK